MYVPPQLNIAAATWKSPYESTTLCRLHRMHESGLMNKWIGEQIPMKDKCSDSTANQGVEERKVNVADMQGIFFVLFMGNVFLRVHRSKSVIITPRETDDILFLSGVAGSIILLCCEFYCHWRRVSKRRNLQPFHS